MLESSCWAADPDAWHERADCKTAVTLLSHVLGRPPFLDHRVAQDGPPGDCAHARARCPQAGELIAAALEHPVVVRELLHAGALPDGVRGAKVQVLMITDLLRNH